MKMVAAAMVSAGLLCGLVSQGAHAADVSTLTGVHPGTWSFTRVKSFTGTLTVKTRDPRTQAVTTVSYKPGDTVPDIPNGAEISVTGGSAELTCNGIATSLPAGAIVATGGDSNVPKVFVIAGTATVAGRNLKAGETMTGVTTGSAYRSLSNSGSFEITDISSLIRWRPATNNFSPIQEYTVVSPSAP